MGDFQDNPRRQLSAAWQTAAAALDQWREQVTAATTEARDQVSAATTEAVGKLDPALRSALDAVRSALSGNWGACQCPCYRAHPQDQGVCDHSAVLTRRVDDIDMPLCAPCAVAQGVAEMRR